MRTANDSLVGFLDLAKGGTAPKARHGLHVLLKAPVPLANGAAVYAVPETSPEDITDEALGRLQADVAGILSVVADPIGPAGRVPSIAVEKQILAPKRRFPVLVVSGPLHDVCLEVLVQLLMSTRTDRIRLCRGCSAVFYRTGRQTHCSPTCRNRYHWANLSTAEIEKYRKRQCEKNGWTRGARLQRIATEAGTGRKKTPQVRVAPTKNARHSTGGKSGR
jgi:hypothetical protein